eukprot:403368512
MKSEHASLLFKNILFIVAFAIMFGVEFSYRKPLFDRSIELQLQLQEKQTKAATVIFKIFSVWGDGYPYFIIYAFILNWENRARSFYYLAFLSAELFVVNITKMAYHEPRPFMFEDRLNLPSGCSTEYGNLSGHSLFAASFNLFVFLDFYHGSWKGKSYSKLLYAFLLFLAVALFILVGFSRFYLNVHTFNQIVYGWTFGIWLAFYFHFCMRDILMKHIENISERKEYQVPYMNCISISFLIFVAVFMSQVATYLIVEETFTADPKWIRNIYIKCGKDTTKKNGTLSYKQVIDSGISTAFYGGYLGILVYRKIFGVAHKDILKVNSLVIIKFVARIIVMGIMGIPAILLYFLLPDTAHLAVLIIFKTLLPVNYGAFIIYGFSYTVFKKLRLLNKNVIEVQVQNEHSQIHDQSQIDRDDAKYHQNQKNEEIEMVSNRLQNQMD